MVIYIFSSISASSQVNQAEGSELDEATCLLSGEDIVRTFDNAHFTYYSTCKIALIKNEFFSLYTQTTCDAKDKCVCNKVSGITRNCRFYCW